MRLDESSPQGIHGCVRHCLEPICMLKIILGTLTVCGVLIGASSIASARTGDALCSNPMKRPCNDRPILSTSIIITIIITTSTARGTNITTTGTTTKAISDNANAQWGRFVVQRERPFTLPFTLPPERSSLLRPRRDRAARCRSASTFRWLTMRPAASARSGRRDGRCGKSCLPACPSHHPATR